jgi:NADH-quinone oxidoreductase subunit G
VLVIAADPVNDAPILDLRLRKGIRRHGLKLAVASPAPSSLDQSAASTVRHAPGAGAIFAAALSAALTGVESAERLAREAGAEPEAVSDLAALLRGPASDDDERHETPAREVVIVWGERLAAGPNGEAGVRALLEIAEALDMTSTDGAGLLEIPTASNGRGLREAGVLPNAGPGLSEPPSSGRDARAIAEGLAEGDLAAVYLLHSDPLRDLPDEDLWGEALTRASTVIAHASFLTEGIREHATVVFPAEAYPEKEGTIVHPDGRVQRLRPAIAHPGAVRSEWQILAEMAARVGLELDIPTCSTASRRLFEAVPFYAGLTLEEIGGRGVRWPEREAAASFPAAAEIPGASEIAETPADALELAGFRSVWDAPEVEFSPALSFLFPHRELV